MINDNIDLQKRRILLNADIEHLSRLVSGAENLVRAAECREVREKALLELNYATSQLELARDRLADVNASIYLSQNVEKGLPLIALGLKQPIAFDFASDISNIINERLGMDPFDYKEEMEAFKKLREDALVNFSVSEIGVDNLMKYWTQLWWIEKRFFGPLIDPPLFAWFDSLNGTLIRQRSFDFERASILFNVAAVLSQLAVKLRSSADMKRAAALVLHVAKSYTNAASVDLESDTLKVLVLLLHTQAHEINVIEKPSSSLYLQLSAHYDKLFFNEKFPTTWMAICDLKRHYYNALGLASAAEGVTTAAESRACLEWAYDAYEEAQSILDLNRNLRENEPFTRHLQQIRDQIRRRQASLKGPRLDLADYKPPTKPDLESLPLPLEPCIDEDGDVFATIGPLPVFASGTHSLTPAKSVTLSKESEDGVFGFSVRGNMPVFVTDVDKDSPAQNCEMSEDDIIVSINNVDTRWATHDEIVQMIKACGKSVSLQLMRESTSVRRNQTL